MKYEKVTLFSLYLQTTWGLDLRRKRFSVYLMIHDKEFLCSWGLWTCVIQALYAISRIHWEERHWHSWVVACGPSPLTHENMSSSMVYFSGRPAWCLWPAVLLCWQRSLLYVSWCSLNAALFFPFVAGRTDFVERMTEHRGKEHRDRGGK